MSSSIGITAIFVGTINHIVQTPYLHKQHPLGLVGEDLALVFVAGELRAVVVLIHESHIHSRHYDVVGWHHLPRFNLYIMTKKMKGHLGIMSLKRISTQGCTL